MLIYSAFIYYVRLFLYRIDNTVARKTMNYYYEFLFRMLTFIDYKICNNHE